MTEQALTDNLLSQQLDEYRLEALLGHGGMARVYRGFDTRLKRRAAIKVIDTPFQTDPAYTARFEREAQAIAQLKHPHVVGVYRYGEANGLLYIAMEYIEGDDLETVLAKYHDDEQFMPPAEMSQIIRPVCLALDYVHSQGVIHRDIKPSNIMLNSQGQPILTDFGLVLLDYQTRGEIFGTPHYIAPEQVVSSAGAVPQSDLYSLGVILYEIFTGKLPFEADHPYDIAMLHLTEPPPPPRQHRPDLSPELEAVILKALAKEPGDRYPNGAALADALEQALQVKGVKVSAKGVLAQAVAKVEPRPKAAPDVQPGPGKPSRPVAGAVSIHAAKKGQVITTRYILKNIRSLLTELTVALTEEELRRLYFDLPEFKPVHHQLARSKGKAEIIDRLLEYAEQTLQLDDLLALARENNRRVYEKHQPYYEIVTAARRDLVGRDLGRYHLVERLGQGGMADVYKAYQAGLARYVAVKVIHSHLAEDEEFIERFESEAMAVAGLHHSNIVQVFDFAREDDLYYMVMEFVEGSTLEAELKKHKERHELLPLVETAAIFEALASAIDYAHEREVIHRDLKPANIMFTPRRRVVLTDFGIARIMSMPSYTSKNAVIGTPAYMSPEQAQGEMVDKRSDIYSLGVILYEMATGQVPFEGDHPIAIVLKLVNESWPLPTSLNPNLPIAVEQVIVKAMSKNPDDRYQSAGEIAQALQQALALPNTPSEKAERKTFNVQRSTPEIEVKIPAVDGAEPAWLNDLGKLAANLTNLPKSNQVATGQSFVQVGTMTNSYVSANWGNSARTVEPLAPRIESHLAIIYEQLDHLKADVTAEAPPEKKAAALERLHELREAFTSDPPDLDTVAYVKSWFGKNIPALAEAVTALIGHPSVGQLMVAAGETVAAEYRRRFGEK
ncbi:MAG: protein kinase [Anaerolineae bacterium]|nr:protein kinase [Anaerolineae bacterium]